MSKYEVRYITDGSQGTAMSLDHAKTDTRRNFPWVVWGPCVGFALGRVIALFSDQKEAEVFAEFMNVAMNAREVIG